MSITCDAPMRMLVDAVIARFGAPGRCLRTAADPETGEVADVSDLAANDHRSAQQRAHDAIAHVLRLGLEAGPGAARGVGSIVVRLSAGELDAIEAGARGELVGAGATGGIVVTDAGTPLTARQALAAAEGRSWFLSALRDGREEMRRVDVDGDGGSGRGTGRRLATRLQRVVLYAVGHGTCTHPGCERAAAGCQDHHVRHPMAPDASTIGRPRDAPVWAVGRRVTCRAGPPGCPRGSRRAGPRAAPRSG